MKVFVCGAVSIMVGSFSFRALYFQLLVHFNIYKIGILIHSNAVKYIIE